MESRRHETSAAGSKGATNSAQAVQKGSKDKHARIGTFLTSCSRGHYLQPRQSPAAARLAAGHPELVADQPPAAAVQDRWSPDPAYAVLHPAARREPLDSTRVWADSRA